MRGWGALMIVPEWVLGFICGVAFVSLFFLWRVTAVVKRALSELELVRERDKYADDPF